MAFVLMPVKDASVGLGFKRGGGASEACWVGSFLFFFFFFCVGGGGGGGAQGLGHFSVILESQDTKHGF